MVDDLNYMNSAFSYSHSPLSFCFFLHQKIRLYKWNYQNHNSFIFLFFSFSVYLGSFFLSLIDDGQACLNTLQNWTCLGGYLEVYSALWKTVNDCGGTVSTPNIIPVGKHLQKKCDNQTTCVFTVEDSSFNVSCIDICSRLDYSFSCVSKSLVVLHYFNKETIANSERYSSCKSSSTHMTSKINMIKQINRTYCYTPNLYRMQNLPYS